MTRNTWLKPAAFTTGVAFLLIVASWAVYRMRMSPPVSIAITISVTAAGSFGLGLALFKGDQPVHYIEGEIPCARPQSQPQSSSPSTQPQPQHSLAVTPSQKAELSREDAFRRKLAGVTANCFIQVTEQHGPASQVTLRAVENLNGLTRYWESFLFMQAGSSDASSEPTSGQLQHPEPTFENRVYEPGQDLPDDDGFDLEGLSGFFESGEELDTPYAFEDSESSDLSGIPPFQFNGLGEPASLPSSEREPIALSQQVAEPVADYW